MISSSSNIGHVAKKIDKKRVRLDSSAHGNQLKLETLDTHIASHKGVHVGLMHDSQLPQQLQGMNTHPFP